MFQTVTPEEVQSDPAPPKARWHRVRTPPLQQMEAVECGATALGIVLQYYGKYVPQEELRVACGVSRDGSRASNIRRAAERYGLICKAWTEDLAQFWEHRMPAVVFWNFNHFVVIEGFRRDRIFLNDPASGHRTVTLAEFNRSFTGVVLTFEPAPGFIPSQGKSGFFRSLLPRLKNSRSALVFILACTLLLMIPGVLASGFFRVFVDEILIHSIYVWLKPLLIIMVAVLLLLVLLQWARDLCLLRLETRLALSGTSQLMKHLLNLPVVFYQQRSSGEIYTRLALTDRLASLLSGDLARTAFGLSTMVFYGALMCLISLRLTLISTAFAAATLLVIKGLSRRRRELSQASQQELGRWAGLTMTGLNLMETLKADGGEEDFFQRWAGYQARITEGLQKNASIVQALMVAPHFFQLLNAAVTLGIGGFLVMEGKLSFGLLVAYQVLGAAFMGPVDEMVNMGNHLQDAESGMARADDVLRHADDPEIEARLGIDALAVRQRVKLSGAVEFRNVTFGYNPLGEPLFSGFNLKINPGERVALVGPTGSGKSSLIRLLIGLYQPWEGEILLDGKLRLAIPREIFTKSVAMVDQDIVLFEDTVRNNLTLWDRTVPERNIVQAAKDACIHDIIVSRSGGYDNKVEEGGRNFSGGQRQRLELARALVNEPSVIILDEATSALDTITEKQIDNNLRRRCCTCIIVAHRLSTIRDCDQIVVLDQGRTVQQGTHSHLMAVPGLYAGLVEN
jgi:NHLM bacteriocin system ABC transporter peptidase/ATP-binding protein